MNFVKKTQKIDRSLLLTGQIFFREQKPTIKLDLSSRQIFAFCGILALPTNFRVKSEHQYTIVGFDSIEEGRIIVGIDPESSIDLKEKAKDCDMDQLLLNPIWRI